MSRLPHSKTSQWKLQSQTQIDETKVADCFNHRSIATLRKSRRKTQIKMEESEKQDFIYQVLEESDQVLISEDQVFFEARGRERHNSRKIYLGSDVTMQDKEDLYSVALLGELTEHGSIRKERSTSYNLQKGGKQSGSPKKGDSELEVRKSSAAKLNNSKIEKLSEILELNQKVRLLWKSQFGWKNNVVKARVHDGKVSGKQISSQQMYYCKVGLVPIRETKANSKLDEHFMDVKRTKTRESSGELRWDEGIEFVLANENGLCVELWSESLIQEQSKKKSKDIIEPKRVQTLIGQCTVELGRINEKKCQLVLPQDSVIESSYVSLSIDLIESVERKVKGYSNAHKFTLYKKLLDEVITYQISKGIPISFGSMEPSVEDSCMHMASLLEMSEFERAAAEWSYYRGSKDINQYSGKFEVNLIILNSKWESQAKKMEQKEQQALLQNINNLYQENLENVKYVLLRIPPRSENALVQINKLLGILHKLFLFLKDRDILSPLEDFKRLVVSKIKEGVYSWYARTDERILNKESLNTYVHTLDLLCQHVIKLIQMLRKYYPGQSSVAKIDIAQIAMVTIDPLLAGEVEMCIQKITKAKASDESIFSLFSLERKIKLILKEKNLTFNNDIELHLDFHVEWFHQFTNKWVDILKKVSADYVDKVIKFETDLRDIKGNENISSSAYDIAICLYPNYCFHTKMQEYLDTGIRIHLSFQVVLLIQETLMRYIQIMGGKISQIVEGSEKSGFKLTTEICQILNNIHFVKEYLEELPRILNTQTGDGSENVLNLIKEAEESLSDEKMRVLSALLPHFNSQIKKYSKNLASEQDVPVEDLISDLMEWLVANIQICSTQLTQAMFYELLEELWDLLLENTNSLITRQHLSSNCSQQIFKAINILYDFFYNDGEGISSGKMKTKLYTHLVKQLRYEMTSSDDLVLDCVKEFANINEKKFRSYGRLTFSMVYYEDRAILETDIMKLENICNPSFTGKFKPMIQVSILPKSHNFAVAHTKVIKFAQDMFINEVLQIDIPGNIITSVSVKISLYFRDVLGIRDESFSGSIHVNGENVGRGSTGLESIINQTDTKVGCLVERNFIYPFEDDDEKVKILRKRTDSVAQGFLKEMTLEQKMEQSLNKYQNNVTTTAKLLPALFKKN